MSSGQYHLLSVCFSQLAENLGESGCVSPFPFSSSEFNSKRQLHAIFGWCSLLPWLKDRIFCCRSVAERNDFEHRRLCTSKLHSHEISSRWCHISRSKSNRAEPDRITREFDFCSAIAGRCGFCENKLVPTSRLIGELRIGMLSTTTTTVCRFFLSSIKILEPVFRWCPSCAHHHSGSHICFLHPSERCLRIQSLSPKLLSSLCVLFHVFVPSLCPTSL